MDIFKILNNLYTNRKSDWMVNLDDSDIQPVIIQKWLSMNDRIRVQTRFLDKYTFNLKPKKYLSLAWSVLPKSDKVPFSKYIKQLDSEEDFDFILKKVRKHFKLSDRDYESNKQYILNAIRDDMINWFSFYGVEKQYWKRYQVSFNELKNFGPKKEKSQKGLAAWGL